MTTRIAVYVMPPYTVFCESVEELKSEKSEGLFESESRLHLEQLWRPCCTLRTSCSFHI